MTRHNRISLATTILGMAWVGGVLLVVGLPEWIGGRYGGNYWLFGALLFGPLLLLSAVERYIHWDE